MNILKFFMWFMLDQFMFCTVDDNKSSVLTNADATPAVLNPAYLAGARERVHRGVTALTTAAAEAGSKLRFCRVKSSDMIVGIRLDAESFGTGSTMDIGLYRSTKDGGAVRDADLFASAVDMATLQKNTQVLNESAVLTIANLGQPIWQAAGYTVDPQCDFDIVGTLAAPATVAGTACLTVTVAGGY